MSEPTTPLTTAARQSYMDLAAQARSDGDYEGEATVLAALEQRDEETAALREQLAVQLSLADQRERRIEELRSEVRELRAREAASESPARVAVALHAAGQRHTQIADLLFRAAAETAAGDTAAADALTAQARQLAAALPTGGAR